MRVSEQSFSIADLVVNFTPRVRLNESMARHTSWHVGGAADIYFEPRDRQDLSEFLQALPKEMPLWWLGLGSNLLVRDGGLRGAVIITHGALNDMERRTDIEVWCEAGVACARIARQCTRWGLRSAGFFAGIPGTLGGALAMNAGAFGGETWKYVSQVEVIDRNGSVRVRQANEYRVNYRHVQSPVANEGFLAAVLKFEIREPSEFIEIPDLLSRRRETQPIGQWSCGSVFTNPPGDHAARLIEAAGLKGLRVGGASVSNKHANFIINEGAATASDLEQLIQKVQANVEARFNVHLNPEVRIVGEAA
ncbi:MAG: UDP-N-acetylmuramate dehydrogenase [Gammaproteobacteria bacterium]|nr:UDP-N-acetylmuramate dehydrogenase [Gammaproteobacteria bacterium]